MENVSVAFEILQDRKKVHIGHKFAQCYIVFDIKMMDVAGVHMTKALATINYTSKVARDTVKIALILAALNDLQVMSSDILNVYVKAPVTEKMWTTLGPEFGKDYGKTAVIVKAFYDI